VVKLTVLFGHPTDVAAFEDYYVNSHLPLAERSGVPRVELAKAVGAPDGGKPAYYRSADLYFDSMEHMQEIMGRAEGGAMAADLANFATGGVTLFTSEIES
jgi:uncharacterized protein (TIGR02118 family)